MIFAVFIVWHKKDAIKKKKKSFFQVKRTFVKFQETIWKPTIVYYLLKIVAI